MSNPGGDGVEAETLCAGLSEAGHEAIVANASVRYPGQWDIVHLFNVDRAPELAVFLNRHDGLLESAVVLAPVFSSAPVTSSSLYRDLSGVANLVRSDKTPSAEWIPGHALKTLASRVDGLHFHTLDERNGFIRDYPAFTGPSVIQPPPVHWPDKKAASPPIQFDEPFAVTVGRIEPLKNQVWLLESGVTREVPIVFIGAANPKRPRYLARFKRALAGDSNAHWLGRCDHAQIRAVLECANVHVLASERENYGLATAEALSLGCEALVPQHHAICTEHREALHLFDLGQPETLIDAVGRALQGPKRASHFAGETHSVNTAATTLLSFYEDLLRTGSG